MLSSLLNRYTYDKLGNVTKIIAPMSLTTTYIYDKIGSIITEAFSGGATTTLTYDSRDRVTSKVTKNSGGTKLAQEDYTYTNNSTGLLTTTTVPGDDNACTYTTSVQQDALGRNVSETNRQGGVTTYTYDMAGNVTKVVTPRVYGDYSITYTYDHAGNVLSETETGLMAEEELKQTTINRYYEYDMLGRLKSSTDGKGKKTNYTYWGGMDWVKEIKTPFSGTTTGKTTYEYDILGNVTKESVSTGTNTTRDIKYEYDALNRVTKSTLIS